jgi:hypothetical protein
VGQAPPLAARPQHVEDGIEDVAPHVVAGPARLWGLWQQQLDELPFVVGEICRIRYAFHPLVYMPFPFFTPVSDSFLRVRGYAVFLKRSSAGSAREGPWKLRCLLSL